jgi:alkylresorcinol/alkylpyrone synthase
MRIASVGCALPKHRYDQSALIDAIGAYWSQHHHNTARLQQLHAAVRVGVRHTALPMERYADLSFAKANKAFIEVGVDLGAAAITEALDAAGLTPGDVDIIFSTTVTGIATPSLDARLCNRLGFRSDIKRVPMFGLGCVAGAAGISRLHDYLKAHPDQVGVLLSVELCSLTIQRTDASIANLIATGLFGDGAAAVVAVGASRDAQIAGPTVRQTRSRFYPDTERVMGWDITDTGMQIVLAASVPALVSKHIRSDVDGFLDSQDLTRADISSWVCHPGGPKVLEAMQEALEIDKDTLGLTWQSLDSVGNLSSASVLFVLRDTIAQRRPPPGSTGLMLAMGPGFCSELVLLDW